MNENLEKILWLVGLILLVALTMEFILALGLTIPYCLYMGAYFRGKNWLLGWEDVKVIRRKL